MCAKKSENLFNKGIDSEVKQMFKMLYKRLQDQQNKEDRRLANIEKELSILNSKIHDSNEWLDLRAWNKLTGETKNIAIDKCHKGIYKTKSREKKGDKWFIHRSELKRHL